MTRRMHMPRWALGVLLVFAGTTLAFATYVWRLSTRPRQSASFNDADGHERVRIIAADEGGRIELLDAQGNTRLSIRQSGDEVAIELVGDESNARSLRLVVSKKDQALLSMRDGQGERVRLHAGEQSELALRNGPGTVSVQASNANAGLRLDSGSHQARLAATATETLLHLDDTNGSTFSVEARDDRSSLRLASPGGKSGMSVDARRRGTTVSVDGRAL